MYESSSASSSSSEREKKAPSIGEVKNQKESSEYNPILSNSWKEVCGDISFMVKLTIPLDS
jgi:hypothetical protein